MKTEVLSISSPEAEKILYDFRVAHSEEEYVAEVSGDGILSGAAAPERVGHAKIFIRYWSRTEWKAKRAGLLIRWVQALRIRYLTVTWLPMLLALAASRAEIKWDAATQFGLAFLSVTFLQFGAQLWNDFEDHVRGIDLPGNGGGSGVIQRLWIPAFHIRIAAMICLFLGCVSGVWLLLQMPSPQVFFLALFGIVGTVGAASYSGWPWHYKYLGLGEFIVFFLTGPLLTAAAGFLITAELRYIPWFCAIGIPFGMLSCLRLHIANVQKIPFDAQAGTKTLASALSFNLAKKLIFWSMLMPYFALTLLVIFGMLPSRTLLAWISIPIVAFEWSLVRATQSPLDPVLHQLRFTSSWQHAVFGAIFLGALLV